MGDGVLINGFLIALPKALHTWRNSPDAGEEPEGRRTRAEERKERR